MEKTLSMGAFTELEEALLTNVCGGSMPAWLQAGLGIVISSAIEASEAEKRANEAYTDNRRDIVNTIYNSNGNIGGLSQFSMNYWQLDSALSGGTNASKYPYLG